MYENEILKNLIKFVDKIKEEPTIVGDSLNSKSVESLVLKNKYKSIKLNFIDTYQEIFNYFENEVEKNDSIFIDVCCGLGFFTEELGRIFKNVRGVDLNKSFIDFAKLNSKKSDCNKIEYFVHDINNPLTLDNYFVISSIFGVNNALNPINVIENFIKLNPKYIILFDGNSNSLYGKISKLIFHNRGCGLDFNTINCIFTNNNFKIVICKNIHTLPSFLIDLNYIGFIFKIISIFLRNFNVFSASKLIIAKNMNF